MTWLLPVQSAHQLFLIGTKPDRSLFLLVPFRSNIKHPLMYYSFSIYLTTYIYILYPLLYLEENGDINYWSDEDEELTKYPGTASALLVISITKPSPTWEILRRTYPGAELDWVLVLDNNLCWYCSDCSVLSFIIFTWFIAQSGPGPAPGKTRTSYFPPFLAPDQTSRAVRC